MQKWKIKWINSLSGIWTRFLQLRRASARSPPSSVFNTLQSLLHLKINNGKSLQNQLSRKRKPKLLVREKRKRHSHLLNQRPMMRRSLSSTLPNSSGL
jgi:hypothetical protein